jgi:hypothetical protein
MEAAMKIPIRFLTVLGVILTLAMSAWSGAMAAKGFTGNDGKPAFSGTFLSRVFVVDTTTTITTTDTPGVTNTSVVLGTPTPQTCGDDQDEIQQGGTSTAGGTSQFCDDDQGEGQHFGTPVVTGTFQAGEDDQGEDQQNSTPIASGTPAGGGDDQGEDGQFATPFSGGTFQHHDRGIGGSDSGD